MGPHFHVHVSAALTVSKAVVTSFVLCVTVTLVAIFVCGIWYSTWLPPVEPCGS